MEGDNNPHNLEIDQEDLRRRERLLQHTTAGERAHKEGYTIFIRRMRLFSRDCYASLDFQGGKGTLIRKNPGWDFENVEPVDPKEITDLWQYVFKGLFSVQELAMDEGNPLRDELTAFLQSVRDRTEPIVDGNAGCAAVAIAERVQQAIRANAW